MTVNKLLSYFLGRPKVAIFEINGKKDVYTKIEDINGKKWKHFKKVYGNYKVDSYLFDFISNGLHIVLNEENNIG